GPTGLYTFIVRAPGAATVHLEFDRSNARTLPTGGGYTAGWITHNETRQHPVLIGLNNAGEVVGTFKLPIR
ncbi:hypothetical protein, partial [Jatrophihabitans endophyticus]|uniref:hypothetical protein n=1 Tax=Jatrophihabitans endophyticus TaxID=1206085 RepID=UPI0026E9ECE1